MSTPIARWQDNPYGHALGDRDVMEALESSPARLQRVVEAMTPAQFARSYAPGKWTAVQILLHLAQTEAAFGLRVRMAVTTPGYVVQPFDQDAWLLREPLVSGLDAWRAYRAIRQFNLPLFRSLTPDERALALHHPERGTIHVEACCMSMLGGIQPGRLRSYLVDALEDGPSNDGLIQRFQLLVWPDTAAAWRYVDRAADPRAEEAVAAVFRALVQLDAENPLRFRFDTDARNLRPAKDAVLDRGAAIKKPDSFWRRTDFAAEDKLIWVASTNRYFALITHRVVEGPAPTTQPDPGLAPSLEEYFDRLRVLPCQFNYRAYLNRRQRGWPTVRHLDGVRIYHNAACMDEARRLRPFKPQADLPPLPPDAGPLRPREQFWRKLRLRLAPHVVK